MGTSVVAVPGAGKNIFHAQMIYFHLIFVHHVKSGQLEVKELLVYLSVHLHKLITQ